jgi:putative addiction module killer protein
VYYKQRGEIIALLLCGGDKRTQDRDIEQAIQIASSWKE